MYNTASVVSFFRSLRERFLEIPVAMRPVLYFVWAYRSAEYVAALFTGVYIYLSSHSIPFLMLYAGAMFISVSIGYGGTALISWWLKLSIHQVFRIGVIGYASALALLALFPSSPWLSLVVGCGFGISHGAYYLGLHRVDLAHISNHERDVYNSFRELGVNMANMVVPALASGFFAITAYVLGRENFSILFGVAVLGFVGVFFRIPTIPNRFMGTCTKQGFIRTWTHPSITHMAGYILFLRIRMVMDLVVLPVLATLFVSDGQDFSQVLTIAVICAVTLNILTLPYRSHLHRYPTVLIGVSGIIAVCMLILSAVSWFAVVAAYVAFLAIFTIANAFAELGLGPTEMHTMDHFHRNDDGSIPLEVMATRDLFVCIGRMSFLGILVLLFWLFPAPRDFITAALVAYILTLLPLLLPRWYQYPSVLPAQVAK